MDRGSMVFETIPLRGPYDLVNNNHKLQHILQSPEPKLLAIAC